MGLFDTVKKTLGGAAQTTLGLVGVGGEKPPSGLNRTHTENPMIRKLQELHDKQATTPGSQFKMEEHQDMSGPLPEYEQLRSQTKRDIAEKFSRQGQESEDALQRAAARVGGTNAGAFLKQGQIQRDRMAEAQGHELKSSLAPLDFQEAQTRRGLNEASKESLRARNFQREALNIDNEFKQKAYLFDSQSKLAQLDLAWRGFEEEQAANDVNAGLGAYQAQRSGGLLGGGGLLGTGIGAGGI